MLAFDITQFFPLLNHQILSLILLKAGFDPKVLVFFQNYLIERKTSYFWNNFSSPTFCINMGVGQGFTLSLVLSALYLTLLLYILENWLKNLKIPISTLSFVNNKLFISQNKSLTISNSNIFYSYYIMTFLLEKFGLIIEHGKTKVFHFSRLHSSFNPLPLDPTILGGPILYPKTTQQYLEFIFDRKLTFQQHVDFYANKALSTIKCMKMLENFTRGLPPHEKCLLYRSCIFPIVLYGFLLWFLLETDQPLNQLY